MKISNDKVDFKNIDFAALFNDIFVQKCSKFYTFQELVDHCDYAVNSRETFLSLPESQIDCYIRNVTIYNSWEDMFGDAVAAYVENQLSAKTYAKENNTKE